MDVERVLRNSPATVTMTFYNGSVPVNADGAVTVTVKRADGTTLSSGSASGPTSNVYSFVISAQANLNFLTITWSCTISSQAVTVTSYAEIVGGFLFSLSELRALDSRLTDLTKYPDAKLIEERLSVESEFEDITGRSFTPRFYREDYVEVGDGYLYLQKPEPSAVTKLTVDGVDRLSWVTSNYLRTDPSEPHVLTVTIEAASLMFASQVVIEYEYGLRQVPRKVRDAALKRAKVDLFGLNSAIDERAVTVSTPEFGTMTLATPGRFGWETGIPDVDVVLERFHLDASAGGVF